MKALTICQPHAFFIALPDSDPRCKRVENRGWYCHYRGELAIHAGKSKEWLGDADGWTMEDDAGLVMTRAELDALPFGAFVAVANVMDCLGPADFKNLQSFYGNPGHICGPYCLVLENVRILPKPIPAKGALGLWQPSRMQQIDIGDALATVAR